MNPGTHPRDNRRLRWTLAALAAVPVISATREIALGPQGVPGGSPEVSPTVDSSLRYANVFKLALGPVIWSHLDRPQRSNEVTWALSAMFVGGLARTRSWRHRGRPHPAVVGALALELVAPPLMIAWQRRTAGHHA